MPRRGRDLEELVRDLEHFLAASPVEVKSPDYVRGRLSGNMREVDVSVRGNVGSMSLLAIIECRKRKYRQDVTWIEQIATKRNDVGANHAVAVSSRPFSSGAISMAARLGIELRTSEEIGEAAALEWVEAFFRGVEDFYLEWDDVKVKLRPLGDLTDDLSAPAREGGVRIDAPFLHLPDGTTHSLDEAFFSEAIAFLVSDYPAGQTEWSTPFVRDFVESDVRYMLDAGGRRWEVMRLSADLRVRVTVQDVDIQRRYRYSGENGQLSRSPQASATHHGLDISYTLHDDGSRRALVMSRNDGHHDRMFRFVMRTRPAATSAIPDQDQDSS
jgi:hypothetical protein